MKQQQKILLDPGRAGWGSRSHRPAFANKHPSQWGPNLFRAHVLLELIQGLSRVLTATLHSLGSVLNKDVVFESSLLDGVCLHPALHGTFSSCCANRGRR